MIKKITILSLAMALVLPFSAMASHSLELSVDNSACGTAVLRADFQLSDPTAFSTSLDGVVMSSGTFGSAQTAWDPPVKTLDPGTHSFFFKLGSGEDLIEKTLSFEVIKCEYGGGGLVPCQIDGTCPCYGFTYWELKKGYCSAEHMILPAEYIQKQKMIQLATLLEQLVELYKKLVALR